MIMDNEPAGQMSIEEFNRHLAQTVEIHVHEPRLNLSQGSFLRCSRHNVSSTIKMLISSVGEGPLRLTVRDSVTAASLRRKVE